VLDEEFRSGLKVVEHSLLVRQHSSLVPRLTILTDISIIIIIIIIITEGYSGLVVTWMTVA